MNCSGFFAVVLCIDQYCWLTVMLVNFFEFPTELDMFLQSKIHSKHYYLVYKLLHVLSVLIANCDKEYTIEEFQA